MGSSLRTVFPCRRRLPATSTGWGIVVQQREQMSISPARPERGASASVAWHRSSRFQQGFPPDIAHRRSVEHIALAAWISIAVVLDVHGTPP